MPGRMSLFDQTQVDMALAPAVRVGIRAWMKVKMGLQRQPRPRQARHQRRTRNPQDSRGFVMIETFQGDEKEGLPVFQRESHEPHRELALSHDRRAARTGGVQHGGLRHTGDDVGVGDDNTGRDDEAGPVDLPPATEPDHLHD